MSTNPFETINQRLSNIENLILDLKHKPGKSSEEEILPVKGAAEFLGLTVSTIYTKVSKGELPYMKRSKRLYFSKMDLISYLKKGRVKTVNEIKEEPNTFLK